MARVESLFMPMSNRSGNGGQSSGKFWLICDAKVLTEHCAKFDSPQVLFGYKLVDLTQDESGVKLKVEKDNGETVQFDTDWVVSVGGGKSGTRKLIGLNLEEFLGCGVFCLCYRALSF